MDNAGGRGEIRGRGGAGDINRAGGRHRNILAEKPDAELDGKLSNQLLAAVGEVVTAALHAKLNGIHEMVKVLTPQQKKILLAELDKPDTNPDLTELVGSALGEKKK